MATSLPTLTCREAVEQATDYYEGVMPPEAVARLQSHLAECEGCANYFAQLRLTVRALSTVAREGSPRLAPRGIIQAFRDWKASRG